MLDGLAGNQLAAVLALFAAFQFGIGMQFTQLGLRTVDSQRGTLLTIASSTALYWAAAPWLLESSYWQTSVLWLFVLIGLFRPFLSSNLSIAGTALLGPTVSSTLSATAPFFALLFGVFLLEETLGLSTLVGSIAIVLGVMLLARQGGAVGQVTWPWWALALPVGAAIIRVAAHYLAKVGMETLPSPYFVGLVSYSASMAVALANNARRRTPLAELRTMPDACWFLLTGLFYGSAVLTLNFALQYGDLSTVGPIVSSEPLFVMVLGVVFFRERQLTRRVIGAVAVVVAGVILVSLRA